MPTKDSRVDAYISKSASFAKPILTHLRKLIHAACPDVVETIKWGMPHFEYKGPLCGMASFKQHCAFGFWKRKLIFPEQSETSKQDEAMGQFGRITSVAELPKDKLLLGYLKRAVQLNEQGIKLPPRPKAERKELIVPPDLMAALKKNAKAKATFDDFSYSHRKEYVEWISEAKREETRKLRLATTIEWLTKGKARHWKYERC